MKMHWRLFVIAVCTGWTCAGGGGTLKDEYVLLSPPDHMEAWRGFLERRRVSHPEMDFVLVNTFEIYNAYPFKGWETNGVTVTEDVRLNAAESIHEFIRGRRNDKIRQYFVLGGAWIDAENGSTYEEHTNAVYQTVDGGRLTLTNAVPGVYVHANPLPGFAGPAPSDLFYACLDLTVGGVTHVHPWRPEGAGRYFPPTLTNSVVDTVPDVVVSRLPFEPWVFGCETVTVAQAIAAYADKVEAAERKTFAGARAYAGIFASGGQDYETLDDPTRTKWGSSYEAAVRYRFRNDIEPYESVRREHLTGYTNMYVSAAVGAEEFWGRSWELVLSKAHGNPDECIYTGVTRKTFEESTNLCKVLLFAMTCNTGWPDYETNGYFDEALQSYICQAEPSLGAAAVMNPHGGSVTGVHNARPGFFKSGELTAEDLATCQDGPSTEIEGLILGELMRARTNIGESWRRGIGRYAAPEKELSEKLILVALQEMLYGDPLIRINPRQGLMLFVK